MTQVEFGDDAVEVDATVIAEGLGMTLPVFREEMQAGRITSVVERGVDTDLGRHRLTFFSAHRRFRLIVDQHGLILKRSALDFSEASLPASVHRGG
ncbi:MAG: DUF6522 family protein [Bradyrhizobium sp.]|uniref:DUF6522 family protein n=1 Tax=Bradyrhizobium sp. TaxID=376 RepID=UPI003C7A4675